MVHSAQQRSFPARLFFLLACLGPLAVPARAQERGGEPDGEQEPAGPDSNPGTVVQPAETPAAALVALESLEEYFHEATRLYASKVLPMREGVKRERAQRRYFPRPEAWAERFLRVVSRVPGSEAEARAWGWVVANAGGTAHGPVAAEGLVRDHLASPHVASLCEPGSIATEAQLERVFRGSPLGLVRARAGFELAERLLQPRVDLPMDALGAKGSKESEEAGQPVAADPAETQQARQARGVAVLEELESGLAGVRLGERAVPAVAADRLYAWRKLRPGMAAPPITGTDLGGSPLPPWTDEPCKARVLLFWRTREMGREPGYGALRTLQARYAHRGVRLAGVNGDRDTRRAGRVAKLQRMPMPSLADGAQGGAAASAYRIDTWPSAVLLDGQGRIVRRGIGLAELPAALDAFLLVVESGGRKD